VQKILAADLLSLAVVLTGVPGVVTPPAAQAAKGWRLAGKYRGYEAACRKADQLEACGYQACVKKQGRAWCVYYR
jgi:hypothetical protein